MITVAILCVIFALAAHRKNMVWIVYAHFYNREMCLTTACLNMYIVGLVDVHVQWKSYMGHWSEHPVFQ